MKTIGLTGGIGTGKSTVSEYLKNKGCIILDADEMSRRMTDKGAAALEEIGETFGRQYISADGNLDRKALGDLVFADKEALAKLQNIITEKVKDAISAKLKQLAAENCEEIVIIDAPLLFECSMEYFADENWLVTANLEKRIERVIKRDGLTREQIISRINNQMPEDEKISKSRYILDNSDSLENLYKQIDLGLERIRHEG